MSDPTPCKNTRYPHLCHPAYAKRYGGYCRDCDNTGVPALEAELAAARAERDEHIRRWAEDSCETEESIEADAARAGIVRRGSPDGVEPIEDVVSRMADDLVAARAGLKATGRLKCLLIGKTTEGDKYELCWCHCVSDRCIDESRCSAARGLLAPATPPVPPVDTDGE